MSAIKGLKNLNALLEKPKYEGTKVGFLTSGNSNPSTLISSSNSKGIFTIANVSSPVFFIRRGCR